MSNPARILAVRLLQRSLRPGSKLHPLFQGKAVQALSPPDRQLAYQLVLGVLRHLRRLDFYVEQLSSRPLAGLDEEVLWILRLALYQLEFLRTPERAVVHEAVEACRALGKTSAKSFVNALLRSFLRDRPPLPEGSDWPGLALIHSHPDWLVQRYWRRFGPEATRLFLQRNNREPQAALWVNLFRITPEELGARLSSQGIPWRTYPALPACLLLENARLAEHPLYRQGLCFFMDVASQEVAYQGEVSGCRSLADLCAAPGGKSFVLASRRPPDCLHVCADRSLRRLCRTRERARLYGVPGLKFLLCDLTCGLPLRGGFDFILLDVPCSGLGTLRSNPDIRWKCREEDLLRFQRLQLTMLQHAFQALGPGGQLLYSTCSTEPEENEQVVETFLAGEGKARLEGEYFRSFPHEHPGEAFFAARIRHR